MLSSLQLRWLSILALLFALTQANWFDTNIFFNKRQGGINSAISGALSDAGITGGSGSSPSTSSGGDAGSTSPTSSPPTTSGSGSTSSVNSPTSTPPSTSPSSTPSSTSTPQTSSSSSSDSGSSTSTSSSQSSTSKGDSTTSHGSSTSVSESVHISTQVTVVTDNGSSYSTTKLVSSTSTSGATDAASQQKGGSGGSSGMSTSTRNAIIGACVGVGGAALLGALAFVFFRLRKSRRNQDESDGLMGFRTGVDSAQEKSSTASGAPNQFQSTLESYHAPPRNANVSSNF